MSKKKSNKKSSKKNNSHKKTQRPTAGSRDYKSLVRLSQCMIVKNEEKNIERALSWGKDIVCEQIVVDTGSTDRTVEIAERMGAKVLHFEWIDDFSAAKNYTISQASGNWIAFLDADEYFQPDEMKKIMPLLEQIHPDKSIDFVRTTMAHMNTDGTVASYAPQDRLFRKHPEICYRYRIHEQLYRRDKESPGCFNAQDYLMILHTGYGEHINRPEKGARNAAILEKEVEENPKDAMRLMYLGDAYNIADREAEALECYRKVIWDPEMKAEFEDDVVYLRAGLQLMRVRHGEPLEDIEEEFLKVSAELRRRCGDKHPDLDYYMGYMYLKKNELEKAAVLFEKALEKVGSYRGEEISNMSNNLELPNCIVAGDALNKGNMQKAVQFAVGALQANKFSPDGLKFLLMAFMSEHKSGMSVDPYWNFLFRLFNMSDPKDLLFIWKMAQEAGFAAMEERAYTALPPEIRERIDAQERAK